MTGVLAWWQVAVLAVVEGITEFLPVSSTGHLVAVSELLKISQTDFVKTFEIAIQLGAIMAVVGLYFKKLANPKWWRAILLGFGPTMVVGLILYPIIKGEWLGNTGLALLAIGGGGAAIIGWEKWRKKTVGKTIEELGWQQLVGVGIWQCLAMVPGVSRAAATIVGGMVLGLSRKEAVEYSFLLAVPTMAAATGLDLVKSGSSFGMGQWLVLAVGFGLAWLTAAAAVKWLVGYVERNDLTMFGWYRIGFAVVWSGLLWVI